MTYRLILVLFLTSHSLSGFAQDVDVRANAVAYEANVELNVSDSFNPQDLEYRNGSFKNEDKESGVYKLACVGAAPDKCAVVQLVYITSDGEKGYVQTKPFVASVLDKTTLKAIQKQMRTWKSFNPGLVMLAGSAVGFRVIYGKDMDDEPSVKRAVVGWLVLIPIGLGVDIIKAPVTAPYSFVKAKLSNRSINKAVKKFLIDQKDVTIGKGTIDASSIAHSIREGIQ